jgi:hypothetical protein
VIIAKFDVNESGGGTATVSCNIDVGGVGVDSMTLALALNEDKGMALTAATAVSSGPKDVNVICSTGGVGEAATANDVAVVAIRVGTITP